MDLNTVDTLVRPRARAELPSWQASDAVLAGGTWLFSEPQPGLRRLIDLPSLGWDPFILGDDGLILAATCTISALSRIELPASWRAAPLVGQCCRALLGSFKIWNAATVGGNLCLALPAGPMIALAASLDGICVIWTPDGGERRVPVAAFVTGPGTTALRPGEILRSIEIPADGLRRRTAFRRVSLTPDGRSGALVIGTAGRDGALSLTVTASTRRPVPVTLPLVAGPGDLAAAIEAAIPPDVWFDDVHGAPEWRRHVTGLLAEEVRAELAGPPPR